MDISIVVPVYNVTPYIERCLSSVMRQTYEGAMECLVVDDCGTDDSIAIAERMIAAYTGHIRFQILHHESNRGLSAARNTGTESALGEYIFYLDSDDELLPSCIEKLIAPIVNDQSIEVAQGNYKWIKIKGVIPRTSIRQSEGFDYMTHESVQKCSVKDTHAWNKLIRKDFLSKNQLQFKEGLLWEDLLWDFYLSKNLSHFYYVPDVTYLYYRNPLSITTSMKREEKILHYMAVDSEIASNLTLGMEDKEALRYLPHFLRHYLVAKGELKYQHAYTIFYKALMKSGDRKAIKQMEIVRWITSHAATMAIFEIFLRVYHLYQNVAFKM